MDYYSIDYYNMIAPRTTRDYLYILFYIIIIYILYYIMSVSFSYVFFIIIGFISGLYVSKYIPNINY
jgi:hypothetical protein